MMQECRRCLLKELSAESFVSVYTYIENLPPDQKAGGPVYEQRLLKCRACDKLVNGMCSLCGCFAEVRAAKRRQYCPNTPRRWDRDE